MDEENVHNFFVTGGQERHFHKVIALHESPHLEWSELIRTVPLMPRGWFELARLSVSDRIEFTQEYWLSRLPFCAAEGVRLENQLSQFFENLEEIGIYATQSKKGSPFDVHMVYSLKGETSFFQGCPPAQSETIETLIKRFAHIHFPPDYLAFLKIHDGFSKYTDTGLIKSRDMARVYQRMQLLLEEKIVVNANGQVVDPGNLIPFYESFGLHSYQCFYADWHPKEEMGNVFFSQQDHSISHVDNYTSEIENLAFHSFLSWLIFYLEDIWHL